MKECNVRLIYNTQFFFSDCHYISYLTCHNSSHLRTNSINFSSISEQAALVASKHSKCYGGDVRLFTLSESAGTNGFGPVPSRQIFSLGNGDGTELRRDGDVPISLITHEKILLNGDVPRRNGNETYSANRPLSNTTCCQSENDCFQTCIQRNMKTQVHPSFNSALLYFSVNSALSNPTCIHLTSTQNSTVSIETR